MSQGDKKLKIKLSDQSNRSKLFGFKTRDGRDWSQVRVSELDDFIRDGKLAEMVKEELAKRKQAAQ
jgi:hypothetical protein